MALMAMVNLVTHIKEAIKEVLVVEPEKLEKEAQDL